tara:strand:- start:11 stop:292 length:282 start_codon:yes stop_codon:yes gene_type:complete
MTVKALKKKNNMKPFKLRSGNKPSMAKLAGVSPMRDMIREEGPKVPEKELDPKDLMKRYRKLESIENRDADQEKEFSMLGRKLDEIYKEDDRN